MSVRERTERVAVPTCKPRSKYRHLQTQGCIVVNKIIPVQKINIKCSTHTTKS